MLQQPDHNSSGFRGIGPTTTLNGQSIDEALLELDEPTQYHGSLDSTVCLQHAAKYPTLWRLMPQEGRRRAATNAWVQFEAHHRAAPDDCDVMDARRLAWNEPARRVYLHGQFRNNREIDGFAARMVCAAVEPSIDPSLSRDDIESRVLT